jgi:cytochrome c553
MAFRAAATAAAIAAIVLTMAWPATPRAGALSDQVSLCTDCHGENGLPQDKATPVIAGQHQGYLYLQLRDYKNGDRKNDVMEQIAGALEKSDMMALAEYFSQKSWPDLRQPRPSDAATARALRANVSIGCTGCHLGEYQGSGTQPRLAGQGRDYLLQSMLDFRSRKRGNNPGMSGLMIAASEDDLAAMAEYLAGK